MTTNIVATITGNGAALTAELNKTFGAIPGMARRVGDQVGDLFGDGIKKGTDELKVAVKASERSIQEIRANIRNTNGAIQFDSSGIKSTIAARQQELQGIEALERALSRKTAKESDATRETQVYLATLRATVDEERQAIAALTSKAQVLDNLQAETGQAAVQQARLNATTGHARAGMQQLGFQISDVSQSFASGVSPMVIFGQQASQVVQAVGMMTNKTSGLIGFLVGPFGAALTAAVTVLGTLYFAHNKAGDGADGQGAKEKTLTERIKEQNKTLMRNIELQSQRQQGDLQFAKTQLGLANGEIVKVATSITDVQAQLDGLLNSPLARSKDSAPAEIRRLRAEIESLQKTLASKITNRDIAAQTVRAAVVPIINRRIDGQFDKAAAEANRYEDALGKLQVQFTKGQITQAELANGAAKLRREHEANTSAIEANTKAARDGNASSRSAGGNGNSRATEDNDTAQALQKQEETRKRISDSIAEDISRLQTVVSLDAMRARGLTLQAEQEEALTALRARYRDLLDGEPAVAAKALGITQDQVLAMREQLRIAEKLTTEQVQRNADRDATKQFLSDMELYYQKQESDKKQKTEEANRKARQQMEDLASFYQRAFQSGGQSIWSDFKRLGKRALAELAAQSTIKLLGGNSAAGGGGVLGGLMGNGVNAVANLFGLNKTKASQQGGSGGTPAPDVGAASGLLNKVKIPGIGGLGDVAGAAMLAYSLFGGALKSTKKGSATLGFSNGELGVGATSGNSGSRIGAAKSGITAVGDLLNQIAEGVGGTITGAGSVSLGMRKKNYVVDTSGRGRTKGSGVLSFKNEQDAIEAALRDALQDGVISGISAASQKIIASGQDLQKAIQKAVMIESIPKALKARMNPVGAALDALNAKWDTTIAALKEGGASAAQMADAEKLYRLEREDAMKAANDNLKEFINSLNFGGASTYSLMDQSQMARADLDKYLGNINSGNFGAVDQQKYLASAQEFLNIQRELNGSGTGWFNSVDELRNATQKLADGLQKGTADAATRDPFAQETASNTQATAEILAQHSSLLVQQGETLANIAQSLDNMSANGGGFIGSDRRFVGDR